MKGALYVIPEPHRDLSPGIKVMLISFLAITMNTSEKKRELLEVCEICSIKSVYDFQ